MGHDAEIHALFDPFLSLDPRRYDQLLKDLQKAKNLLSDPKGTIGSVETDIEDWTGGSRTSFLENIVSPYPATVQRQMDVIDELMLAVAAAYQIVLEAQKDIVLIALGTEATLEGLDGDGCCDKDALTKALGIFGAIIAAVTGFAGIFAAAGVIAAETATAIGVGTAQLGLINAVGGATNNFLSTPEKATIKGKTPAEVLDSAKDSISKLKKGIDDQEGKLKETLQKDIDALDTKSYEIPDIDLKVKYWHPG